MVTAAQRRSFEPTGTVLEAATVAMPPAHPMRDRLAVARAAWAAHAHDWQYAGGKRDLRIDFLRGFAVLAMVADHLGGEPSWLYNITGGNKFLFSAAEGFVFISGLVMGIVYAGMIAKQGVGPALWKALRRAGTLYLLTVILTFAFSSVSLMLRLPWMAGVTVPDPMTRIVERLSLHRAFYLTDVLLMYTLLIAAAPLALLLIVNKRTPLLLAVSWLLWAAFQFWPDQVAVPWNIEDNSIFHLAAWQVLFFTALVIGYHRERVAAWARRIPTTPYLAVLTILCAGLIWFDRHSAAIFARFSPDGDPAALTARFFDKGDVRIGRLIAFAIFFQFFLLLVTVLWKPLLSALGWLLLPLGQSALLAYSTHLFVIALFTYFIPQIPALRDNTSAPVNTLVQMAGLGLIYAVVRAVPMTKTIAASVRETVATMVAPTRQALVASRTSPVIERRGR